MCRMNIKAYMPPLDQIKSFLLKLGAIGFVYFVTAYIGIYFLPYIKAAEFFELSAIAIAAVVAVRYGWAGVLGSVLGSLFYHLLYMPLQISLALALIAGLISFLLMIF